MAFQTYGELIDMASNNPQRASSLVRRAQRNNIPVVSPDNPGYGDTKNSPPVGNSDRMAAMRRRAAVKQTMKADQPSQSDTMVDQRKQLGY